MTEPSQYFKGRTVQEQMNEVIGYVDTRAAEVATTAIASDVAQVHQDMLDADADAAAAAASAASAAGTLANAVKKTGEASQSIAGDIAVAGDLTGGTVTVPTPTNNTDAASKKYVDDADATKISITDVNFYAVGLTGAQTAIAGSKTFKNPMTIEGGNSTPLNLVTTSNTECVVIKANSYDVADGVAHFLPYLVAERDMNGVLLCRLSLYSFSDGRVQLNAIVRNADGTNKTVTLAEGNQ